MKRIFPGPQCLGGSSSESKYSRLLPECECGSMLSRALLRGVEWLGDGSLSPKNEGPLIAGRSSVGVVRAGFAASLRGSVRVGASSGAASADVETGTGWPCAVEGAGTEPARREAPHIPQKRFWSALSLPQRLQRTNSLLNSIAYAKLEVRCRGQVSQFGVFPGTFQRQMSF